MRARTRSGRRRATAESRSAAAVRSATAGIGLRGSVGRTAKGGPLPRKVHDFLAHRIGSEIVGGAFRPGSLLPSETALRQRFSVSRTALREAYRALDAKGLIVSRPKIGTRVRPKSEWNMLDPDVLAWQLETAPSDEFVTHLFQLREMIEPPAAALAAASRDDAAVSRIAAAYAEMARFKDGSGDLIKADLEFHQAILEATGNYFLGAFGSLIHAALICSFELGWQSAATMHQDRLLQHRAVLHAIGEARPDQARARMATLLRDSIEDVRLSLRRRARRRAGGQSAHPAGRFGRSNA